MNDSEKLTRVLSVLNTAFYQFVDLTDLPEWKRSIREVCLRLELKGTVLLSPEGMNGYLAGSFAQIREFQAFLRMKPGLSGMVFKESESDFIPFQKLFVKIKKEIIPLGDREIQPHQSLAPRMSPQELKRWLDEGREFHLLDTRNDYEIQWGTFQKATHLDLHTFRQFSKKLDEWPEENKNRPMVMFCTGGIRCEKAALVAIRNGCKEVYQLDGGILKYFEECGGEHYQGHCFVFDERVALDSDLRPAVKPSETVVHENRSI